MDLEVHPTHCCCWGLYVSAASGRAADGTASALRLPLRRLTVPLQHLKLSQHRVEHEGIDGRPLAVGDSRDGSGRIATQLRGQCFQQAPHPLQLARQFGLLPASLAYSDRGEPRPARRHACEASLFPIPRRRAAASNRPAAIASLPAAPAMCVSDCGSVRAVAMSLTRAVSRPSWLSTFVDR